MYWDVFTQSLFWSYSFADHLRHKTLPLETLPPYISYYYLMQVGSFCEGLNISSNQPIYNYNTTNQNLLQNFYDLSKTWDGVGHYEPRLFNVLPNSKNQLHISLIILICWSTGFQEKSEIFLIN